MSVSRDEVARIAALARLALAPEEVERLTRELARILEHVERFRGLEAAGDEPGGARSGVGAAALGAGALRADEPGACLTLEEALYNAPQSAPDPAPDRSS